VRRIVLALFSKGCVWREWWSSYLVFPPPRELERKGHTQEKTQQGKGASCWAKMVIPHPRTVLGDGKGMSSDSFHRRYPLDFIPYHICPWGRSPRLSWSCHCIWVAPVVGWAVGQQPGPSPQKVVATHCNCMLILACPDIAKAPAEFPQVGQLITRGICSGCTPH